MILDLPIPEPYQFVSLHRRPSGQWIICLRDGTAYGMGESYDTSTAITMAIARCELDKLPKPIRPKLNLSSLELKL